jgi:hypothetical protein
MKSTQARIVQNIKKLTSKYSYLTFRYASEKEDSDFANLSGSQISERNDLITPLHESSKLSGYNKSVSPDFFKNKAGMICSFDI